MAALERAMADASRDGSDEESVQARQADALLARDRCCRYPECTHRKWLDAHHVMHWVDGGKTSLDNTLLLCDRHHRLLHEGGYRLRTDHRSELFLQTARSAIITSAPVDSIRRPRQYVRQSPQRCC